MRFVGLRNSQVNNEVNLRIKYLIENCTKIVSFI